MQKPRSHLSIDKWHLDEMVVKIKGQQYHLWRAMDKHGQVLDDKLPSYRAAKKKLLKGMEHRQHKGLNNRAKNSHRPMRVRERRMGGALQISRSCPALPVCI